MGDRTHGFQVIRGAGQSGTRPQRFRPAQHSQGAVGGMETFGPAKSRDDLTAALRAMEQRLAALVEDRGQLTRDLHDCVLQSLYAIGLTIESNRRAQPQRQPLSDRADDLLIEQLNTLIQEVRNMIRTLESGNVQEFDLVSELKALIRTYRDISTLQISIDIAPRAIAIATNEEKREVLMIIREAVSNCVRHAKATRASISLYAQGPHLRLAIADDGVGFTPGDNRTKGYGFANMSARAKKLGGRLLVRSHVGEGTHILVEFSLEPEHLAL
ncbi:MAG: histidine kinase [Nitrospira sp.]|nr:histidine kinase [Nitrospira sp.]